MLDGVENDRIRHVGLRERVTSADEAAALIEDGMTVGMSASPAPARPRRCRWRSRPGRGSIR